MPLPDEYKYLLDYGAKERTELFDVCGVITNNTPKYLCGGGTIKFLEIEGTISKAKVLQGTGLLECKPIIEGYIRKLPKTIEVKGGIEFCLELEAEGFITRSNYKDKC